MTVVSVTSASVGTKLATAADTKITGITMTQPAAAANADMNTPLTLLDAAAAPTQPGPVRTLFSAAQAALAFVFGVKPTAPSMAPGLTAPTWPAAITPYSMTFANGVWVASCPAGITFSVTTAP